MIHYLHEDREYRKAQNLKPYCSQLPSVEPLMWGLMEDYLYLRSLSFACAKALGWYPSVTAGDAEPRVVIPATSRDPANVFWQARGILQSSRLRYQSPHARRGDALIYLNHGDEPRPNIVLVEGPMDALAVYSLGCDAIAWMGMTPPEEAIAHAQNITKEYQHVYVVGDSDAETAACKLWKRFLGAQLLTSYPYKDLAAMPPLLRAGLFPQNPRP